MINTEAQKRYSKSLAVQTTSLTLLESLRVAGNQEAWNRFVRLYTPLLYHWARRTGLAENSAEDLVQDVFELLLRKLPDFHYRQAGNFRAWLRVVALNRWRERWRKNGPPTNASGNEHLEQVVAPDETGVFEELEYRRRLVHRALQIIEPEFSQTAWRAFKQHVLAGRDASEVAVELGVKIGTVYAAKSRIMTRLRCELDGLMD